MSTRGNLPRDEEAIACEKIDLTPEQYFDLKEIMQDHAHQNIPEIHRVLGITGHAQDINTLQLSSSGGRDGILDPKKKQELLELAFTNEAYILPNLRRLLVMNASIFLWRHLISVHLTELDYRVGDRAQVIAVSDFMKVVSQLEQLQVLKVRNALTLSNSQSTPQKVKFSRLQKLHATLDPAKTYRQFMSYFPLLGRSVQHHLELALGDGESQFCMKFDKTFELGFHRLKFIVEGSRHLVIEGWFENGLEQDTTEPSFKANLTFFATSVDDETTRICNKLRDGAKDSVKILDLHWKDNTSRNNPLLSRMGKSILSGFYYIRHGIEEVNVTAWRWQALVDCLGQNRRVFLPNMRRLAILPLPEVPMDTGLLQILENAVNMEHRRKLEEISIGNKTIYREPEDNHFHVLASLNLHHE